MIVFLQFCEVWDSEKTLDISLEWFLVMVSWWELKSYFEIVPCTYQLWHVTVVCSSVPCTHQPWHVTVVCSSLPCTHQLWHVTVVCSSVPCTHQLWHVTVVCSSLPCTSVAQLVEWFPKVIISLDQTTSVESLSHPNQCITTELSKLGACTVLSVANYI